MQIPPNEGPKISSNPSTQSSQDKLVTNHNAVRQEKIQRLREAVQNGSYTPSTTNIAKKIVNSGILNQS